MHLLRIAAEMPLLSRVSFRSRTNSTTRDVAPREWKNSPPPSNLSLQVAKSFPSWGRARALSLALSFPGYVAYLSIRRSRIISVADTHQSAGRIR